MAVWLQLGSPSSSIQECKYGLKQAACAPQHSARGSQMVHPEVGTRRGKQETKVSLVSLQEGLCCIVWSHEGIAPNLSTKGEGESHLYTQISTQSVFIFIDMCTYKYMYVYICCLIWRGRGSVNYLIFQELKEDPTLVASKERGRPGRVFFPLSGILFLFRDFIFILLYNLCWKLVWWSRSAATFYRVLDLSVCRGDILIWYDSCGFSLGKKKKSCVQRGWKFLCRLLLLLGFCSSVMSG